MHKKKVFKDSESGFTILEILAVLLLLAALYAIVGTAVGQQIENGRRNTTKVQIGIFKNLLKSYKIDNGVYPTTEQGLDALVRKPTSQPEPQNWNGPYSDDEIPKDPWGNAYIYRCPGTHNPDSYDLYSYGSDGKEGGEDKNAADITNW
jgi:general secretion pathway protein G